MTSANPSIVTLKDTQVQQKAEPDNRIVETLKNLRRNRSAVAGAIVIGTLIIIALIAPIVAPYDPNLSMIGQPCETGKLPASPPCIGALGCTKPQHVLGLDLNARDVFSRLMHGARTSLVVGISSVAFAITVGTVLGLVAGYVGSWTDNIIMRFMDVLLAFPSLLLAITIVTVRGPGLENALLAIAFVSIPVYARLIRASVLSVKETE